MFENGRGRSAERSQRRGPRRSDPAQKIQNDVLYTSFNTTSTGGANFTVTIMADSDSTNTMVDIAIKALTAANAVYDEHTITDVPIRNGYVTTYSGTFFRNFNLGLSFMCEDWGDNGHFTF